jgi:hypothetical protein
MKKQSMAVIAVCAVVASVALAGCGPKRAPLAAGPTAGATTTAAAQPATGAPSTPPVQTVKDITPGNCTIYTKAEAVKLLGGVNINNKAIDIGTEGGKKIDVCSYLDLKGASDLQGVSYAVVRYDSAATAFAKAKKVRVEMLGNAAEQNWAIQPLTTPVPGAGQLLGGYGTKSDDNITYTIAVVGTNVGPYLVAALGASTESAAKAKALALKLFQALSSTVG